MVTEAGTYWFLLEFNNNTAIVANRILEISNPVLDKIDLYFLERDTLLQHETLGDQLVFTNRLLKHRNFLVPISFPANKKLNILLRIESQTSMQVPLTLWQQEAFFEAEQKIVLIYGLFYGAMLIMVAYNAFLFLTIKDISYFYYSGLISSILLLQTSIDGISYQYLWPNNIWLNNEIIILALGSVLIFGCLFSKKFLGKDHFIPYWVLPVDLIISAVLVIIFSISLLDTEARTLLMIGACFLGLFFLHIGGLHLLSPGLSTRPILPHSLDLYGTRRGDTRPQQTRSITPQPFHSKRLAHWHHARSRSTVFCLSGCI